jgi:hypothetical protein
MADQLPFDLHSTKEHEEPKQKGKKRNINLYLKGLAGLLVCAVLAMFIYKQFFSKTKAKLTLPPSPERDQYLSKFERLKNVDASEILGGNDYARISHVLNGIDCYEKILSDPTCHITNTMTYRMVMGIKALNDLHNTTQESVDIPQAPAAPPASRGPHRNPFSLFRKPPPPQQQQSQQQQSQQQQQQPPQQKQRFDQKQNTKDSAVVLPESNNSGALDLNFSDDEPIMISTVLHVGVISQPTECTTTIEEVDED